MDPTPIGIHNKEFDINKTLFECPSDKSAFKCLSFIFTPTSLPKVADAYPLTVSDLFLKGKYQFLENLGVNQALHSGAKRNN